MHMKNTVYPKDLLNTFKLLKKAGIKNFENSIPSLVLDLIYNFIWEILYKSRKLAKYAGRNDITKSDIEFACRLELEYACFNPFKIKETILSSRILNSIPLKEKKIGNDDCSNYNIKKELKKNFKIKKKL